MVLKDPRAAPSTPKEELRRSGRFALVIPVEVKWRDAEKNIVREDAEAVDVNMHGAMLRMKTHPPLDAPIELTNRISNEVVQARVVAVRGSKPQGIAAELLIPSETFWGITFKLKRASNNLRNLEQEIKSGGTDPRVLQDFRDAVDHVRKTAWAVYEWQERQFKHKDASTVISLLTTERVRRATQLNDAIAADVDSHELTSQTPGISDLQKVIDRLNQMLRNMPVDKGSG